ncbi:MAG: HAD-IIIA family hydrolase, partial [Saprospiraceae bacterium]
QGIGKNLMRASMMEKVHDYMILEIEGNGGKIDEVYYCPELSKNNPKCRKPNIGMALQAKKDFPDIDFQKSIMVGDSISDIQFGKRVGMLTVFVEAKGAKEIEAAKSEDVDFQFKDLNAFFAALL